MKIFNNWFLVKRPKKAVRKKSEDYIATFPKTNDSNRMLSRKAGFEDGYIACLEDLGINQTIESFKSKKELTKRKRL